MRGDDQLLDVVQTGNAIRLGFRSGERRQKHSGENGNNGDDYQQFDQRESSRKSLRHLTARAELP
jgi:hypothetical protein